jgi:hypothetical protein
MRGVVKHGSYRLIYVIKPSDVPANPFVDFKAHDFSPL